MADIIEISNWQGYENKKDISNMSVNVLAPGSYNVWINDGEMVSTRPGLLLQGEPAIQSDFGIRSSMDFTFKNNVGSQLTLKEWNDNHYVWYRGQWRFLGQTLSPTGHEYHYCEVWDDQLKIPQLVFVNGTGNIYSWDGVISEVTGVTATSVTIRDDASQLFSGLLGSFMHNGVFYSFSGFSGNTLTGVTPNPVGIINNGDAINSPILTNQPKLACNTVNARFDVCESLNNHVFYIDYTNRKGYVSNSFYKGSTYLITYPIANSLIDLTVTGQFAPVTCGYDKYEIIITRQTQTPITSFVANHPSSGTPNPHNTVTTGYTPEFKDSLTTPHDATYTLIVSNSSTGTYDLIITDNVTGLSYSSFGITFPFDRFSPLSAPGFPYAGVDFLAPFPDTLNDFDVISFTNGGFNTYQVYKNNIAISGNIVATTPFTDSGLTFKFETFIGKKVGDKIQIDARPALQSKFFADFTYHTPLRQAGDGFEFYLDSPGIGIKAQEQYIYIASSSGKYYQVGFNTTNTGEDVLVQRLKTEQVNKLLHQNYFAHIKNSIGILTVDRVYDELGRVMSISTPQSTPLSDRVKNDIKSLRYLGKNKISGTNVLDGYLSGQALYYDNFLFITAPRDGVVMVFDFLQGFWQPPQKFAEPIGRLSICDGQLVGHSSISDASFYLFKSSNDNGYKITARIVLPFNSYGTRSQWKNGSTLFTEGYMTPNTYVRESVLFDFGCGGQHTKRLDPKLCDVNDRASLGKGHFGSHGLGNDPRVPIYKFHKYDRFITGTHTFYEASIQYDIDSVDSTFCLVSCGIDAAVAPQDATYDSRDAGTKLQVVDAGIAGTPQTIETGPFGDLTGNATGPTDDRDIDDTTTFWGGSPSGSGNVSTQ